MINHKSFKSLILKIDRLQLIEVSAGLKLIKHSRRELSQVAIDKLKLLKMQIRIKTVGQSKTKMILLNKRLIIITKTK